MLNKLLIASFVIVAAVFIGTSDYGPRMAASTYSALATLNPGSIDLRATPPPAVGGGDVTGALEGLKADLGTDTETETPKAGECPEGVTCEEEKAKPKAVQCPGTTPEVQARCAEQKALADKQVSIGIGTTAPEMVVRYNAVSCAVSTPFGSGKCFDKASRQCPTVQAYADSDKSCFWENCETQCIAQQQQQASHDHPCVPSGLTPGADAAASVILATHPCPVGSDGVQLASLDTSVSGPPGSQTITNGKAVDVAFATPEAIAAPQTPQVQTPQVQTPQVQTPQVQTPQVQTPQVQTPQVQSGDAATGPVRTTPSPDGALVQRTPTTQPNPYQSLRTARNLQNPESFIQKFAGNSPLAQLARFATGADLRNTPEGDRSGEPQVIYVTPDYRPANVGDEYRSIEEIASDISSRTPAALARVDHFARTLTAVGGPNSIDTENKAYGRIQDLIVEDEAIRALRVAEEEGKRAKDSVFCRANETAESCDMRREAKAEEVERRVFIEELEKRVLPQTAIEHFLAVYDGWVRPSPAPDTRATSTLAALHAQDLNPLAEYEVTTGGGNFVWWVIESVTDATTTAINTLVNLITGGDESQESAETPVPQGEES